jgi:hypothetical protein
MTPMQLDFLNNYILDGDLIRIAHIFKKKFGLTDKEVYTIFEEYKSMEVVKQEY